MHAIPLSVSMSGLAWLAFIFFWGQPCVDDPLRWPSFSPCGIGFDSMLEGWRKTVPFLAVV